MSEVFDYSTVDIVIHHANCPDGFAAAWCVWNKYPNVVFVASKHGQPYPDIKDKVVLIMDFSYKSKTMIEMLAVAKHIRILDHHKSALELNELFLTHENFSGIIDLSISGAQIAWNELYDAPYPWYINDIADRDLWKWEIPGSKHRLEAMFSVHKIYKSFEAFSAFIQEYDTPELLEKLEYAGSIFIMPKEIDVAATSKRAYYCTYTDPAGVTYNVRIVECSSHLVSDVGAELSREPETHFAVMFRYDFPSSTWYCSSRANPESDVDLTDIVKHIDPNGGGHPKASGFDIKEAVGNNLHTFFKLVEKDEYYTKKE